MKQEIRTCIEITKDVFKKLSKIWRSMKISLRIKKIELNSYAISNLLYGSKCFLTDEEKAWSGRSMVLRKITKNMWAVSNSKGNMKDKKTYRCNQKVTVEISETHKQERWPEEFNTLRTYWMPENQEKNLLKMFG